jgi:hypothetical protein
MIDINYLITCEASQNKNVMIVFFFFFFAMNCLVGLSPKPSGNPLLTLKYCQVIVNPVEQIKTSKCPATKGRQSKNQHAAQSILSPQPTAGFRKC